MTFYCPIEWHEVTKDGRNDPPKSDWYLVTVESDFDESPSTMILEYNAPSRHWIYDGEPTFCSGGYIEVTHWALRPPAFNRMLEQEVLPEGFDPPLNGQSRLGSEWEQATEADEVARRLGIDDSSMPGGHSSDYTIEYSEATIAEMTEFTKRAFGITDDAIQRLDDGEVVDLNELPEALRGLSQFGITSVQIVDPGLGRGDLGNVAERLKEAVDVSAALGLFEQGELDEELPPAGYPGYGITGPMCSCDCHRIPGVKHVAACCYPPMVIL